MKLVAFVGIVSGFGVAFSESFSDHLAGLVPDVARDKVCDKAPFLRAVPDGFQSLVSPLCAKQ